MSWWEKGLQAIFSGGITPRTAGFNTVDYGAVIPETRLLTDALMFVGGGSGSTAGGIKVTTLMILIVAARAEIRGHKDVNVLDRRIPDTTVRVAISVAMISLGAVLVGTMALQGADRPEPGPGPVRGDLRAGHRRAVGQRDPRPARRRRSSCWSPSCSWAASARSRWPPR